MKTLQEIAKEATENVSYCDFRTSVGVEKAQAIIRKALRKVAESVDSPKPQWQTRSEFEASGYTGPVWVYYADIVYEAMAFIDGNGYHYKVADTYVKTWGATHVMIRQEKPEPPEGE